MSQPTTNDGTCDNTTCDEPTPWDMKAIILNDNWYCSPTCARHHLDHTSITPQRIILHDPQFTVDRDTLSPEITNEHISIHRAVTSTEDARTAIAKIEKMVPVEFRA